MLKQHKDTCLKVKCNTSFVLNVSLTLFFPSEIGKTHPQPIILRVVSGVVVAHPSGR